MRRVAVPAMDIVHVVTVLDRLVATVGPVLMSGVILSGCMQIRGIALVIVVGMLMMGMPVVEVVHVVSVLHGDMTAAGVMLVVVVLVLVAAHIWIFLRLGASVQSSSWACSSTPFTSSAT